MPTIKIAELPKVCTHHDHNPPSYKYFSPGVYKHICPACGHVQFFIVEQNCWYMYPHRIDLEMIWPEKPKYPKKCYYDNKLDYYPTKHRF